MTQEFERYRLHQDQLTILKNNWNVMNTFQREFCINLSQKQKWVILSAKQEEVIKSMLIDFSIPVKKIIY